MIRLLKSAKSKGLEWVGLKKSHKNKKPAPVAASATTAASELEDAGCEDIPLLAQKAVATVATRIEEDRAPKEDVPEGKSAPIESGQTSPEEESGREVDRATPPNEDTLEPAFSSKHADIEVLEKQADTARSQVIAHVDERIQQVRDIVNMREDLRMRKILSLERLMKALSIARVQPLPTRNPPKEKEEDSGAECASSASSSSSTQDMSSPELDSQLAKLVAQYPEIIDYVIVLTETQIYEELMRGKESYEQEMLEQENNEEQFQEQCSYPVPYREPQLFRPILPRPPPMSGQPLPDDCVKYNALFFIGGLSPEQLVPAVSAALRLEEDNMARHFILHAFFDRLQRTSSCACVDQLVNGTTLLYQAIEARRTDDVSILLHNGANPLVRNTELRLTALHSFVVIGGGDMDLPTLITLMDHFPKTSAEFLQLRDKLDGNKLSALSLALMYHDGNSGPSHRELRETARYLLRCGARPPLNCSGLVLSRDVLPLLAEFDINP